MLQLEQTTNFLVNHLQAIIETCSLKLGRVGFNRSPLNLIGYLLVSL